MVRTNTVTLSVIKGIAFRQKLLAGGSGIVILREDAAQPGIAAISKTSGEAIPTVNTSKKLYPQEAFQEAIALTAGLPYKKQGIVRRKGESPKAETAPMARYILEEIIKTSSPNLGKMSFLY